MRHTLVLVAGLLTTSIPAQSTSSTLPKGWDTTEGIEVNTTTNSHWWGAFDTVNTTNTPPTQFTPSRVMFLYDAST